MSSEDIDIDIIDDPECNRHLMGDNFALFLAKAGEEILAIGTSGPFALSQQITAQNVLYKARLAAFLSAGARLILRQVTLENPLTGIPATDGGFAVKCLIHYTAPLDDTYQKLYALPRLPENVMRKANEVEHLRQLGLLATAQRKRYFKGPDLIM